MNFLKLKKLKYLVIIFGLFTLLILIIGCKAKKNEVKEIKYAETEIEKNRMDIEKKLNTLSKIYDSIESSDNITVKTDNIEYDKIDFSYSENNNGIVIGFKKLGEYVNNKTSDNSFELNPDLNHFIIKINKELLNDHKKLEYDKAIDRMNDFLKLNYILVIRTENYIKPIKGEYNNKFNSGIISGKGYLYSIDPIVCIGSVDFTAINTENIKIYSNNDTEYMLLKNLKENAFIKLFENIITKYPKIKIKDDPKSYILI